MVHVRQFEICKPTEYVFVPSCSRTLELQLSTNLFQTRVLWVNLSSRFLWFWHLICLDLCKIILFHFISIFFACKIYNDNPDLFSNYTTVFIAVVHACCYFWTMVKFLCSCCGSAALLSFAYYARYFFIYSCYLSVQYLIPVQSTQSKSLTHKEGNFKSQLTDDTPIISHFGPQMKKCVVSWTIVLWMLTSFSSLLTFSDSVCSLPLQQAFDLINTLKLHHQKEVCPFVFLPSDSDILF